MSELFLENPLVLGLAGGVATAIALAIWIQGSQRPAMYSAVVLAVLTLILVEINVYVQTDRERVQVLIHQVAKDIQNNDLEKILSVIHPNAPQLVRAANDASRNFKFSVARVTGIKQIQVDRQANPPKATAEFYVVVNASVRGTAVGGRGFVRVTLLKSNDRWLVQEYQAFDPSVGFKGNLP